MTDTLYLDLERIEKIKKNELIMSTVPGLHRDYKNEEEEAYRWLIKNYPTDILRADILRAMLKIEPQLKRK